MKKTSLTCQTSLTDENSFFPSFLDDLRQAKRDVVIESPYITTERMKTFYSIFYELLNRNVRIYIITRDPKEHQKGMETQSESEIRWFEEAGINTLLCTGNDHRKLAIIDRVVLWEGSLNILSHTHSREIMRRLESPQIAEQTIKFLRFSTFLE